MTVPPPEHPAKFSAPILEVLAARVGAVADAGPYLTGPVRVLDPFAGVGGVHRLARPGEIETVGVEIEPEWANQHPDTIVGDATKLPFEDGSFDVVATSPCYGNRMADQHEAKDACKRCAGTGRATEVRIDPTGQNEPVTVCRTCKGSGLSRRYTYRHMLGRPLSEGSAAGLRFGPAYETLHRRAWAEARRVLRPYGLLLLNVSNHIETVKGVQVEKPVVEWHLQHLVRNGWHLTDLTPVSTRRMTHGANRESRVENEFVIGLRRLG